MPANLNECRFLNVNENQLRATIPDGLSHLEALEYLGMGWNLDISGTIPAGLARLTNLGWVGRSQLRFTLPHHCHMSAVAGGAMQVAVRFWTRSSPDGHSSELRAVAAVADVRFAACWYSTPNSV